VAWAPIDKSGNILGHVSVKSPSNIDPTPKKAYAKLRTPKTTFEEEKLVQNPIAGGRESSPNHFCMGFMIFL
jgi:hypothetical protein